MSGLAERVIAVLTGSYRNLPIIGTIPPVTQRRSMSQLGSWASRQVLSSSGNRC
jgi:hypothetical protein